MSAYNDPVVQAAYERMVSAIQDFSKVAPRDPPRTDRPRFEPREMHTSPESFCIGMNMVCDSGGYMPGKIPVIVVPARPVDIARYETRGYTVVRLLRELKLRK